MSDFVPILMRSARIGAGYVGRSVFAVLFSALASSAHADDRPTCPLSAIAPLAVPHTRDAIAAHQEIIVVALGSSSTQGWMASDLAHGYPATLQRDLTRLLPEAHVAVVNRGIGGQDAAEEVTRIDSDVIALHPAMVIWQVGANGALRNTDPIVYKRLVTGGITRMQKAGIDVVLMDNQRSPAVLAAPSHLLIDQATAEVAADTGAALFSRAALMDNWVSSGAPYDLFISPDHMHHNDFGYRCLADALARSIESSLERGKISNRVADAKTGADMAPRDVARFVAGQPGR